MTEQPAWFLRLQQNLCTPAIVPGGAVIDWDQCRDRFLVLLLQRLERRTSSVHPATVRSLLKKRLAGDDVAAELSAASAAADARVARAAAAAAREAKNAERTAQLADLQAAIAASAQPLANDQQPPVAQPAAPVPVDLAALRDPSFSDGLTASQHQDVLRGGPDPRLPAPTDDELLQTYEHARRAYKHEGAMNDDWLLEERRGHELAGLRAVLARFGGGIPQQPAQRGEGFDMAHWIERMVTHLGHTTDYPDFRRQLFAAAALLRKQADDLAHFNAWAQGLAPVPVADRPWERPGYCDADDQCWWSEYRSPADGPVVRWTLIEPALWSLNGWLLPHWAIPAIPAEVQP